jgi:hypothetical protein
MTKPLVPKPEDSQTKRVSMPYLVVFVLSLLPSNPVYADHACKLNGWTYERLRQQRAGI